MPQLFADKVVNVRLCDTVISAAAVNYTFHRGKGNKRSLLLVDLLILSVVSPQDREFVDMDLPFNGVGLTKQKQAGSASYPPSPATSELPGCLGCCAKQDKEAQQVHTQHA